MDVEGRENGMSAAEVVVENIESEDNGGTVSSKVGVRSVEEVEENEVVSLPHEVGLVELPQEKPQSWSSLSSVPSGKVPP